MGSLGQLVVYINADLKGLQAGLMLAKKGITGFATASKKALLSIPWGQMAQAVKKYAFITSVALAGLGALIIRTGAKFEQAIKTTGGVMRILGEEGKEQFQGIIDIARQMGEQTEWSATQAAEGLQFLGMAGLTASEAIRALPPMLDLATAGQIDLARASDISTNILAAFGMEVEELTHVGDVLVGTITQSNTNMEMMAESMKYVAPVARGFGLEIEKVSAMIGLLGSAGIQGSMAGTQLAFSLIKSKDAMEELSLGAGADYIDVLRQMQKEGWGVSRVLEVFGARGGRATLVLKDLVPEIEAFSKNLKEGEDVAKDLADAMRDTVIGRFKELGSVIQEVMLTIYDEWGDGLKETLKNASQWIRDNKNEIVSFAQAVKDKAVAVIFVFRNAFINTFNFLKSNPAILQAIEDALNSTGRAFIFVTEQSALFLGSLKETAQALGIATTGMISYHEAIFNTHEALKQFNNEQEQQIRIHSENYTEALGKIVKLEEMIAEMRKREAIIQDETRKKQMQSNIKFHEERLKLMRKQLEVYEGTLNRELEVQKEHNEAMLIPQLEINDKLYKDMVETHDKIKKLEQDSLQNHINYVLALERADEDRIRELNEARELRLEAEAGLYSELKWNMEGYTEFLDQELLEQAFLYQIQGAKIEDIDKLVMIRRRKRQEDYTAWLQQEYELRAKYSDSFVEGVVLGLKHMTAEQVTWGEQGFKAITKFVDGATDELATFFNFTSEEFLSFESFFKGLTERIANIWANMIAEMLAQEIVSGVAGLFTGGGLGGFGQTALGQGLVAGGKSFWTAITGAGSTGTYGISGGAITGGAGFTAPTYGISQGGITTGGATTGAGLSTAWQAGLATAFVTAGALAIKQFTDVTETLGASIKKSTYELTEAGQLQRISGGETLEGFAKNYNKKLYGELEDFISGFKGTTDEALASWTGLMALGGQAGEAKKVVTAYRQMLTISDEGLLPTKYATKGMSVTKLAEQGDKAMMKVIKANQEVAQSILSQLPDHMAEAVTDNFSLELGKYFESGTEGKNAIEKMANYVTKEFSEAFQEALDVGLGEYGYETLEEFLAVWQASTMTIGKAFSDSIDTGDFKNFETSVKTSIYQSIREGMLEAMMQEAQMTLMLEPYFKAQQEAFEQATRPDGTLRVKYFKELITPALAELEGQIVALEPYFNQMVGIMNTVSGTLNLNENIPSYQTGIDYVPSNQLAYLHEGEAVVPAGENRGAIIMNAPLVVVEGNIIGDPDTFDEFVEQVDIKLHELHKIQTT